MPRREKENAMAKKYRLIELKDPIPPPNPQTKTRGNCYQVSDGYEITREGDFYYISHPNGVEPSEVHASNSRRALPLAEPAKAAK